MLVFLTFAHNRSAGCVSLDMFELKFLINRFAQVQMVEQTPLVNVTEVRNAVTFAPSFMMYARTNRFFKWPPQAHMRDVPTKKARELNKGHIDEPLIWYDKDCRRIASCGSLFKSS